MHNQDTVWRLPKDLAITNPIWIGREKRVLKRHATHMKIKEWRKTENSCSQFQENQTNVDLRGPASMAMTHSKRSHPGVWGRPKAMICKVIGRESNLRREGGDFAESRTFVWGLGLLWTRGGGSHCMWGGEPVTFAWSKVRLAEIQNSSHKQTHFSTSWASAVADMLCKATPRGNDDNVNANEILQDEHNQSDFILPLLESRRY